MGGAELQRVGVHGKWCCSVELFINKQLMNNSAGLYNSVSNHMTNLVQYIYPHREE